MSYVGAQSPEELDVLFEDALIMDDGEALAHLVEAGALVVSTALNRDRIWATSEMAIGLGTRVNVSRRGSDGAWRIVISLPRKEPAKESAT